MLPPRPTDATPSWAFWCVFAVLYGLCCWTFWSVRYLPMADLLPHVAQFASWLWIDDPTWSFGEDLRVNHFTGYWFSYLLARGCYAIMGNPDGAIRLVVCLYALMLPLSLLWVTRHVRLSPWLALLAFPLVYQYSAAWGFLSFMLAVPPALVVLTWGLDYLQAPTRRGGLWLALALVCMFPFHGMAQALLMLVIGVGSLAYLPDVRGTFWRGLPTLAPLPLLIAWRLALGEGDMHGAIPTVWFMSPIRALMSFGALVGNGVNRPDMLFGLLVFLVPVILGMRLVRDPRRTLPLVTLYLLTTLLPTLLWEVNGVPGRFAIFMIPALWHLNKGRPLHRVVAVVTPLLALVWIGFQAHRFQRFDAEARQFDVVLEAMEPGGRAVYFMKKRNGVLPGALYHNVVPFMYQIEKRGFIDPSMAAFPQQVTVLDSLETAEGKLLYWPYRKGGFDLDTHVAYDYLLIRGKPDSLEKVVGTEDAHRCAVFAQSPPWWGYTCR